jgi:hypothetical protein
MSSQQATLASEIWELLKDLIPPEDRAEAADALVHMLLDSDVHLDDIGYAFAGDNDIANAVSFFQEDEPGDDEEFDDSWDTDED